MQQLFGRAEALFLAAGFLVVLAMTGLPVLPMITLAGACLLAGIAVHRRPATTDPAEDTSSNNHQSPTPTQALDRATTVPSPFVEPLALELGSGLLGLAQGHQLIDRIGIVREQVAGELGFLLPDVVIRDNLSLPSDGYLFTLRGTRIADGHLQPTHPEAVHRLLEHFGRMVRNHAAELLTRQQVHHLVDRLAERAPRLVEELVPAVVPTSRLHRVLGNLLADGVPIRDLETILETLGDLAAVDKRLRW